MPYSLLVFYAGIKYEKKKAASLENRPLRIDGKHGSEYGMINPLLMCDFGTHRLDNRMRAVSARVEKLIKDEIAGGNASSVAVYFHALDSGLWFGVNENEKFAPGSLMKVPIMIAYLKKAERDPDVLKKMFKWDGRGDWTGVQAFKPAVGLDVGKSYSADELIRRMVGYSDNNAMHLLLFTAIDEKYVEHMLSDLNIGLVTEQNRLSISLKEYSKLFRILYNSTYLNEEMSEKAMGYLAINDFPSGMYAAVPSGIVVLSKFGEATYDMQGKVGELHEVGIVHHKRSPYLIGIMTRGGDVGKLAHLIRTISKLVYDEADRM